MVQDIADDVLWISAAVWVWLAFIYVGLERGLTWLRVGLVLTVIGVAQMNVRALLVQIFGAEYRGRDWLLLTGRLEILVAGIILAVALHRMRWGTKRTRRHARRAAANAERLAEAQRHP